MSYLVPAAGRGCRVPPGSPVLYAAMLTLWAPSSLLLADAGLDADGDSLPQAAADLGSVVVKGQALQGANAPFSVTRYDTDAIRDERVSNPQEMFRFVPGMNVRNLGLASVADNVTLRGFGGGGHGGDVGFVVDGIPLNEAMSHADGYADLGILVPLEIAAMTVYHGPVSALYGNYNRGGLVAYETRKGGEYRNADLRVGSHSTVDAQLAAGLPLAEGRQSLNLAAQLYRTDGYRPQSDGSRGTLSARWSAELSPALDLSVAARGHGGEGDSAAYLPIDEFEANPRGIDPRTRNDGAEKDFGTLRADLGWRLSPDVKLLGFVYGTRQDFTRWFSRPVSAAEWSQREEAYERDVRGGGINFNGRLPRASGALNWVAGVETFRESTDYLFFEGLDDRQRVNPAMFDRTTDLDSVSAFGELEAPLHPLFKPWVAVRHDRFSGDCTVNGPETGNQPCEKLNRINHTSPKLGVRSDLASGLQLRASYAEGFALPSNFIKYSSGAADLEPNVFRQVELGAHWRIATVEADIAWYRARSNNEFRTIAPGNYENFGATLRKGLEASLSWYPLPDLQLSAIYGSADSEIRQNANPALVGNQVTGVPDYTATLVLRYDPMTGWGGSAVLRKVDDYALTADNGPYDGGYSTLDLALTYTAIGRFRYRASLGIDNATDRKYYTSASIFAGSQLVAPAAPRTFNLGVQMDF